MSLNKLLGMNELKPPPNEETGKGGAPDESGEPNGEVVKEQKFWIRRQIDDVMTYGLRTAFGKDADVSYMTTL